jgi:hypothetical protein
MRFAAASAAWADDRVAEERKMRVAAADAVAEAGESEGRYRGGGCGGGSEQGGC